MIHRRKKVNRKKVKEQNRMNEKQNWDKRILLLDTFDRSESEQIFALIKLNLQLSNNYNNIYTCIFTKNTITHWLAAINGQNEL